MANMQNLPDSLGLNVLPGEPSGADGARAKAAEMAHDVKQRVANLGNQVSHRADSAMTAMGGTISSVASGLRGGAPSVVNAAERTAQALESAASYLKESDLKDLMRDVSGVVKRHPVPAVLGAAAIGFLLARRVRR